jgi:hypothetical protein
VIAHDPSENLPEPLPKGERVLWQGRPDALAITMGAYRFGWVAGYFGLLLAWRFASQLADEAGFVAAAVYALWLLPLAAAGLGLIAVLGWLSARTTLYTITDRRLVMRIGIALPLTLNVPFRVVQGAAVSVAARGCGDIAFQLQPGTRIGYAVLWPHARALHFARPEPSLRGVPDVEALAGRIADALGRVHPAENTARSPAQIPQGLAPAAAE